MNFARQFVYRTITSMANLSASSELCYQQVGEILESRASLNKACERLSYFVIPAFRRSQINVDSLTISWIIVLLAKNPFGSCHVYSLTMPSSIDATF